MQQNDNFRLVVRRGPQPNHAFEVSKDVTSLGRDISNDIVINDRETSRHHLRLMLSGDTLTIEDLGSTNGTFVNGKRVSGVTPLQNGDMIGLGETVTLALESVVSGAEAPASAPSNLGDLLPPAVPISPETPVPEPQAPPAPDPTYSPQPADYGLQGTPPTPADPYAPNLPMGGEQIPQQPPAYPAYPDAGAAPPQQQAGYYPQQQPGYQQMPPAPPAGYPGYDYDPYAVREESSGTSPWLILGCFVFFILVFVCFAGIALTLIDVLNLWCDLPVVRDVVLALGFGC